jgi:serine/threonine protein kinase
MHPDSRKLMGLILGTLSRDDADALLQHVAQCPHCDDTLSQLESETDELAAALRAGEAEVPFASEPQCASMVSGASDMLSSVPSGATVPYVQIPDFIREYELLEVLGRGGMGTVYQARHTHLDRPVAIKLLAPERCHDPLAVARFQREMQAVGKLDHPHIVKAYDAGNWSGQPYLVMELVDGINLSRLLQYRPKIRIPDACEMIRQAALGLAHAHQLKLVHRDVKLSNLMLCRAGTDSVCVKVLDLGLASFTDTRSGGPEELTQDCQTLGTPEYMAPEQATAARDVDARADVYGLGISLFKLVTGEVPFPCSKYPTPYLLIAAKTTEPAPDVRCWRSDASAELAAVLQRMLQPSPEDRYASCEEVAEALLPLARGARLQALLDDDPAASEPAGDTDLAATSVGSASLGTTSMPAPPVATASEDIATGNLAPLGTAVAPESSPARRDGQSAGRPAVRRWQNIGLAAAIGALLLSVLVFKFATRDGTILVQLRNVDAAEVYVDNRKVELRPAGDERVFRVAIEPGQRTITVKTLDGTELSTNLGQMPLQIRAGQTIQIEAWFEPAVQPAVAVPLVAPPVAASGGTSPQGLIEEDELHRAAALWILQIGGSMTAQDSSMQSVRLGSAESIAQQKFRITSVSLDVDRLAAPDELRRLQGLSRLASISLGGRVTDAHLAEVARLAPLRDVFIGLGTELTDLSLTHLGALPQLESITISAAPFTERGMQAVSRMPALRRLALANAPQLTDACLAHLESCSSLTLLDLSGAGRLTGSGLKHLHSLPQLESLFLSATGVDDAAAEWLRPLITLRELRLQATRITDAALEHVGVLVNLRRLEIGRNGIRGTGLKHLTALQDLDSLDLSFAPLEDEHLVHLSALPKLRYLNLQHTPITDAAVQYLANIPSLDAPGRRLVLNDTRISADGAQLLRQTLPGGRIEWRARSEP